MMNIGRSSVKFRDTPGEIQSAMSSCMISIYCYG